MAKQGKTAFDAECPKCGKFLGTMSSKIKATRLVAIHDQEDHRSIFEMI